MFNFIRRCGQVLIQCACVGSFCPLIARKMWRLTRIVSVFGSSWKMTLVFATMAIWMVGGKGVIWLVFSFVWKQTHFPGWVHKWLLSHEHHNYLLLHPHHAMWKEEEPFGFPSLHHFKNQIFLRYNLRKKLFQNISLWPSVTPTKLQLHRSHWTEGVPKRL